MYSPNSVLIVLACVALSPQNAFAEKVVNLRLIPHDLNSASRTMTIFDQDESGSLDRSECERLPWKQDVPKFDIDRNAELSHVEVALRQAFLRSQDSIGEEDIQRANVFMNRNDKNRNGTIDSQEAKNATWPGERDQADRDSNGSVSFQELSAQFAFERGLREEMGIEQVDQNRAKRMLGHFDANNDRLLSLSECEEAPLPKPAGKFDETNDQNLSELELATMFATHRREMGLSLFDIKKADGIFARFDDDHDNRIEVKLEGVPEGAQLSVGSGDKINNLVDLLRFDANSDRVVTMTEVEKRLADVRKRLGYAQADYQSARKLMIRYDKDRSQFIEPEELSPAVKAKRLPKDLIKLADLDQDQKISHAELARHLNLNK